MNQGAVWVCDLFKSCTMLIQKMSKHVCCNLWWFALNAFQNDMTWPGSTKNQGGDRFQGIDLDAGQGLPCKDWVGVLPTQTFLNSNLVTPENFIQFSPSVQKLFMIFFNTNGQTPKLHTNRITPISASCNQCDQIGRFIELWATFSSLWQQLICSNLAHS